MAEYKFPDGFKWGSATSSHQVEGGNRNDWTEWETSPSRIEQLKKEGKDPNDFISGKACDSYNRYEEDFDIAKQLNQNIHRFSIEWSRIEPEEGRFDFEAMKHYQRLVKSLRERGIEPMVTLWHFTNPIWFANKGGFLNKKAPEYFTRYAKYVVDNLKSDVSLWITFNEAATTYDTFAYLKGVWPPFAKSIFSFFKARNIFARAHALAYQEIKNIYANVLQNQNPDSMSHNIEPQIGIAENNTHVVYGNVWHQKLIGKLFKYLRNNHFIKKVLPYCDFLGLNYYNIYRMFGSYSVLSKQEEVPEKNWELYPQGIYERLKDWKRFGKPIFITENGIADSTDQKRAKFIKDHLYWIWRAIQDGADVRGYLYWSLIDNFEIIHGYTARFGLVEVDYKTFERRIRPSALEYAKICRENTLNI